MTTTPRFRDDPTVRPTGMRYPLTRPDRLSLDALARGAGLHPELVRRFVALGLLDGSRDESGRRWFTPDDLLMLARIQRLRAGLALNYAAIGLVLDLLRRIDQLERMLRHARSPWTHARSDSTWT